MQTPSTLSFWVSRPGRSKTTVFYIVLNYAKSHHMVVRRPRFPRDHVSIKGVSSMNRVYEMKVLGVTFSDTLSLSPHVKYLSAKSAQNAFALRTLHAHGLSGRTLWTVTQAHIISRLTYACSAWWGFCNSGERDQLAAVVTSLAKKNYLPPDQPTLHEMVATADVQLFNQVVANPAHVLAPLIPPSKSHSYNLRKRPHDLQIPSHKTNILDKNFITRTILALNHTWTELCRLTLHLNYCKFAIVLFIFCFVRASVTALIKRVYYYYYYIRHCQQLSRHLFRHKCAPIPL